jgi:hypothetical protein
MSQKIRGELDQELRFFHSRSRAPLFAVGYIFLRLQLFPLCLGNGKVSSCQEELCSE